MNWQTVVVVTILFLSALASAVLATFAWRRRRIPWAWPFALTTTAIFIWSLGYAFEIIAADLAAKTFWAQVQYIGIATLPVGWFLFAMGYSGRTEWLSRSRVVLLSIIPIVTILLAFSNEVHGLLWAEISLNSSGPFNIFDASYGPAWFGFLVYSYALLLVGSIVLFLSLRQYAAIYRWQLVLLLLAPILPWLGNALYIARLSPIPQLDLAPVLFTISAVILAIGILRFGLLGLAPVARSTVVDSLNEAVFVLDATNTVVDLNPAARHLLGQTKIEPLGQPAVEVLKKWPHLVTRYAETAETQEEILLVDGDMERSYDLQITAISNRRQEIGGRIMVLRDISLFKEAEEAVARDRAKSELLAKVGHELRTPLNGILGLAEMLEFGTYGSISNEQRQATQQIVERTQHLTKLVNDLLRQSRLDSGDFDLEDKEFSVTELVDQMNKTMNPAIQKKNLTLRTTIEANVPQWLRGDPTRLYQILVNLVDNAINFTDKGEIGVRVYCPSDDHWAINVSDTGVGIPTPMRERILNLSNRSIPAEWGEKGLAWAYLSSNNWST